jgi:thiol-disulfide isomerase/thioredoxin
MNTGALELETFTDLRAPLPGRRVDLAPELHLAEPLSDEIVRLSALQGRVVLLHFWAFTSFDCRSMLPILNRWQQQYGERGLQIVGIHSPQTREERKLCRVLEALRNSEVTFPMLADQAGRLGAAYRLTVWPTNVLIDPYGRIHWTQMGPSGLSETEHKLRSLLNSRRTQS